jgi:hypothetical protein
MIQVVRVIMKVLININKVKLLTNNHRLMMRKNQKILYLIQALLKMKYNILFIIKKILIIM